VRKSTLLMVLAVIGLAGTAFGFDGNRRGFVLGGSFGFAPETGYSIKDHGLDENGSGFGLALIIGGSINEQNLIVYEGNVTSWNSDLFHASVSQGFNGPAWYHYYGPTGRSAFSVLGLGMSVFGTEDENNDVGFGVLLGAGYEFSKHWQAGIYFSTGSTSDGYNDYNQHHISLLATGIAF
jgi:hypothetical protein